MASPTDVLDGLVATLQQSNRLPRSTSYVTREANPGGAQADLSMPIVELTADDYIRNQPHNTDLAGYATDSNGNRIGYIFRAQFEMSITINIYTAERGGHDSDQLGQEIRTALFRYDAAQNRPQLSLPDGDGGTLDDVTHLSVGDGGHNDDLSMTPALRRWQQMVDVTLYDEVNTVDEYGTEDYIAVVDYPADGDFTSGSGGTHDVTIEYQASSS